MALTEKDLLIAIQKLKERNAQLEKPVERMSSEEFIKSRVTPGVSAEAIEEKSKKVLEAQQNVEESVTKTAGEGMNAQLVKMGVQFEKMGEGITKLVSLTTQQVDALKDLADKSTDTLGPIEKTMQFFGKVKEAITNPRQFALESMSKTMGSVPIIGRMINKKMETERDVRNLMRTGMSEKEARSIQPAVRKERMGFRAADKKYQQELKESGLSEKEFKTLPGAAETVKAREEAASRWSSIDPTVKYLEEFKNETETTKPTRKDKKEFQKEQTFSKTEDNSDEQIKLLREIAYNTRQDFTPGTTPRTGRPGQPKQLGPRRQPEKVQEKQSFASKISGVGRGMADAGKGLLAISAGLIALSIGLKQFTDIEWEALAKAGVTLAGLIGVSKLLGNNSGSMLKGALGLVALGGALLVAGEAFDKFTKIDWEALAKAGVAIGGLALAAAGIGAFVGPILLGAAAIGAVGAAVWVLAKGVDALADAMDKLKSPKAANKPATGEAPVERPTNAVAAADEANKPISGTIQATQTGPGQYEANKPISGTIQATQTGPGQYEAVSSGITSDDIVNHPNYKSYYEKALGGRKGPDAERMARKTARMKVERDLIKQSAAGVTPTTGVAPEAIQPRVNQSAAGVTPTTGVAPEAIQPRVNQPAPIAADAIYKASAENAEVATVGSQATTNNVVAPTTVTNNNTINSYKPDTRNQESSFKRMLDTRYVPV